MPYLIVRKNTENVIFSGKEIACNCIPVWIPFKVDRFNGNQSAVIKYKIMLNFLCLSQQAHLVVCSFALKG